MRLIEETEQKVQALEAEVRRLKDLIDRDRTGLAEALSKCRGVVLSFWWIANGEWGCYEWEERTEQAFREEIGRCFEQVDKIAEDALVESGRRAFEAFHGAKR